MILTSLTLKNYRSHTNANFKFKKGLNLITGDNAVGKTNIAEAIYFLSLARSFRGVDDESVIKKGARHAEISAEFRKGPLISNVSIYIQKEGKQILINNKKVKKISTLSNCVNVSLFEPKDVMLFRGSPKERRNFLDISLSKQYPVYLDYLSRYEKILKERNEILKSDNVDYSLLEINTTMLIENEEKIISFRQKYVKDINDILIKIARALGGVCEKINVTYKPFVELNENFTINAKEAYKHSLDADMKARATQIGIHREDFSVSLNNRDIATFGSQGENRLVALALKLSPYFLIEDKDARPIIVLDDVMSEFDNKHQRQLITFLKKFEQVFITATKLSVDGANTIHIK